MSDPNISNAAPGRSGIGAEGETKYGAETAPVIANGGNSADQDGVASEQSPESMYGGKEGSLK